MSTTAAPPAPHKPPPLPPLPATASASAPWVGPAVPTSSSAVPTPTVNVTSSIRVPSTNTATTVFASAIDFPSIVTGSASRSTSASTSPPPSRASSPTPSALSVSSASANDNNNDPHARIFAALLAADAPVDECKLRRAARAGIPSYARPAVWNVLLGVTSTTSATHIFLDLDPSTSTSASTPPTAPVDSHGDGQIPRRVRKALTKSRAIARGFGLIPSHNDSDDSISDANGSVNGGATSAGMSGSGSSVVRNNSGNGFANGLIGSGIDMPSRRSSRSPPPLASRHSSTTFSRDDEASVEAASAAASVRHRRRHHHLPHARPTVDSEVTAIYTSIVSAYLENAPPHITYEDHLVTLCIPFVHVMPTHSDAYNAFCALMRHQASVFAQSGLLEAVSNFLAMFRINHPELYDLFAAEDVDMKRWARDWLRGLLVEQLPRRSLLRLWDSYFAAPTQDEGILLHPYVCLVFVQHLKPQLLDCDDGERITAILSSLPAVDIDHIIAHAVTARQQLRDRNIV